MIIRATLSDYHRVKLFSMNETPIRNIHYYYDLMLYPYLILKGSIYYYLKDESIKVIRT